MGAPQDRPKTEATRLGSYEIIGKLARGGMAELFLAKTLGPEGFEKVVVLKKILPHYAANPKFVKLFLDEARLAAALEHPHIAHVYDMGTVDGHYFFAMEYVHGKDLRTTMRRTVGHMTFPIQHAVMIARDVSGALHYAHERRRPDGQLLDIVHRDVSPANILIAFDGVVKLVDFGVAKAATRTSKTRTGTLKGKIAYMSPEQAKGAPVDRRSDIFSLGIVLWEMITGQRLFKSENDLATIQKIINTPTQAPSELRADCPKELDRIVQKALAIDPEKRYRNAEELQLDLEELAREERLAQSSIALRTYMHRAFDAEIVAWKEAQEQGHTLTDFVIQSTAGDVTTAISASELEYLPADEEMFEGDDEDEGGDDDSVSEILPTAPLEPRMGVIEPRTAAGPTTRPPVPTPAAGHTAAPQVIVEHVDSQPVRRSAPNVEAPPAPSSAPMAAIPFPLAPKEWRRIEEPPEPVIDLRAQQRRKLKIWGGVILAIIVLVAVLFAGKDQPVADKPAPATDPVEEHHVEMTPTPPVTPPAPQPAVIPVDAAAPAAVVVPDAAVEVVSPPPPRPQQPFTPPPRPRIDPAKPKSPPPRKFDKNSALPPS